MSELNREPGKYEQLLLDNQLCFPLYAAARKVVNEYNPLLKPYGLTYTQYIVFLALWEKEEGKAKVGCLGKRLYLDCGTLTPLLKKMEESGWIRRDTALHTASPAAGRNAVKRKLEEIKNE